nr:ribonuclease H-like domain-containing protein [Tanacetum cinerariifolium]
MPAARLTPDETEARSDRWISSRTYFDDGNPNLQPPIRRHRDATSLFDQNVLNPGKREQRPSIYKRSPYMEQPPSTVLPKKRGNKTKNNVKKSNLSPLNLGNALDDDNEAGDDVIFLGAQFTGNYLVYENVDVSKVCGSYLHLIKDCDFHEQTFTKRNAEGKGILKSKPTGKPVKPNRPKSVSVGRPNSVSTGRPNPVSAVQPNPISADQPNTVFAGNGILGLRPLNIQSKSTYFHSFTHNNQQIITHNSLYSLYLTGGLNRKTAGKPSAGIVDSGCSRSMSGNKDKLEDFEDFHGGEVTFGGSTGKITRKGTIKTKNLNFENVLYVEELQHFNLLSVSQICDQKYNLYTFSLNELAPKGPLTCLIAKASQNESTLWHKKIRSCQLQEHEQTGKGCDNGTEFKNANLIELCGSKGIRRDYSNARTPQQNKVAKRKNQTLIEAARTMLADSLFLTIFWSEAVATACYVLNRSSSNNLTAGSQGATPSNAGSQEDDSNSDDEPEALIIQSTPTLVQEQAGKEEAYRLGLAFPSLNPMLGVGTSSISSSVSVGSTPSVSAGSTPQMSPCASPISADRHSSAAGKCHVPADIHDGLTIFDCPKSGIFTSSSYDEDFSSPDANNLESSLNVSSTITKR